MTVTTVFASTADGDIMSQNANYTTAANGSVFTLPVASVNELWVGQFLFGGVYSCYESFVSFDLSVLGTNQTVASAVMSTWLITDNSSVDFYAIALFYDWGATVTSADWQNLASLASLGTWWTTLQTSGIGATGAYKSWSDTTDIRALVTLFRGSTMPLLLAQQYQQAGWAPTGPQYLTFSSADVAGTTQDPKITITHNALLIAHTGTIGSEVGFASPMTSVPLLNATGALGTVVGLASPVAFIHGGGRADSSIKVEWDLDGNGSYAGTYEDVTGRVLSLQTFSGKDFPSRLHQAGAGTLTMTCDNSDDAFSFWNTASPLNIAPNSLKTGRRLRVRTAESVPADAVLLVRDRFNRTAGAGLGTAETGQVWTNRASGFSIVGNVAQADDTPSTPCIATVNAGASDVYAQVTVRQVTNSRTLGLTLRWQDASNYLYCYLSTTSTSGIRLVQVVAGVANTIGTPYQPLTGWEGMTIGASLVGSAYKLFVSGVQVSSATLASPTTATNHGLYAYHGGASGRINEYDDFYIWDRMPAEVNGILWTGVVSMVDSKVEAGPKKLATIKGEGVLGAVARPKIAGPRIPKTGQPTGFVVGDVLSRCGALHPPQPLDIGAITTSPVGMDDGLALEIARKFEVIERGTIYETNEGQVGYADSTRRAATVSRALFSDAPGWQYGYSALTPLDRRGSVKNQVIAGVGADAPSIPTIVTRIAASTTAHVDVVMPTTTAGDLLVVFIASTVDESHDWLAPIFWAEHRNLKAAKGLRVYSHFCDGTESGTTVRFYQNSTPVSGLWVANVCRIVDWYESYNNGIAMSDPAKGGNPNAVLHGWGRYPTLFLVTRVGIGATGADSWTPNFDPPDGYQSTVGVANGDGTAAHDVAITTGYKIDCTEVENPTLFDTMTGYDLIDESVVFAVRGYNGPHTKATLEDTKTQGGEGRLVTTNAQTSQDEHQAVLTHTTAALFGSEADAAAFGLLTVAEHADDAPSVSIGFWATKSSHYRDQAIARRVGHRITLDSTHNAGFGINGPFIIESVSHTFDEGLTKWWVRWELSPA